MVKELPWQYGLRFDCPECGDQQEPELSFYFQPNFEGKSLKEAYQESGRQPPAEIIALLTEPFVCSSQQKPVRPPEIDAVILVVLIQ
jgi:hypothetical protein